MEDQAVQQQLRLVSHTIHALGPSYHQQQQPAQVGHLVFVYQ